MSDITLLQCLDCRFKFTSLYGYKCPKCGNEEQFCEQLTDAGLDAEMARIDRIWPTRITVMPVSTDALEALAREVS